MNDMQQYSINFPSRKEGVMACDWNWMEKGKWTMSSRGDKECRWDYEGRLTEEGRQKLLEYFGLQNVAEQLPLEKIEKMAPAALMQFRRALEVCESLPKINRMSDRVGDHVSAELVTA